MPIIKDHTSKFLFNNAWAQTILSNYLIFPSIDYKRERHFLPDQDFMDVDYLTDNTSDKVVLLVHGFEGSSKSNYIKSIAKYLFKYGFNVAAVNLRGCSGHDNLLPYAYHSGKTEDIKHIVDLLKKDYENIFLVGFSLGANLVLKYLADYNTQSHIKKAVAISAPFDLHLSALKIIKNKIINQHFLKSLKKKLYNKKELFPKHLGHINVKNICNIIDVDECYTAPLHGFSCATAYYKYASCIHHIYKITTECLIINAEDDPLLEHPENIEDTFLNSNHVHLIMTRYGGHVGFLTRDLQIYYHRKTLDFFIKQ
ncbi:MAG TPA: alpha/beta fold hydrolase [Cytophagales bacterium]|nr:alpha/beta fold hydrolase [Cytophagales bacterium]